MSKTPLNERLSPEKTDKTNRTNKLKPPINELIRGFLAIVITSVFAILPITLFALSGGVEFKIQYGYLFILFAFICSLSAGFVAVYRRFKAKEKDAKIICDCAEKILKGNYEINELELSNDFKKIGDSLIAVANRLKQAEREKNDFINDFSHELKTPIVSIRGFAKIIAKGNLSAEEEKEYLSIIVSESDRLIDLTASTLMLDRLGSSRLEIEKRHYNVSEQIRKSILLLQSEWEKKDIEFNAEFNDFFVYSNEELTSQLFINVIQNAIKFSNDGGRIDILLANTDKSLSVTVKDYGVGMDEETRKRMFDKYFRGDKSRSTHGNGLGLATVKKIAQLLNLEIKVISAPQKGTSFTITFKK